MVVSSVVGLGVGHVLGGENGCSIVLRIKLLIKISLSITYGGTQPLYTKLNCTEKKDKTVMIEIIGGN